jgi:hypothetical protein
VESSSNTSFAFGLSVITIFLILAAPVWFIDPFIMLAVAWVSDGYDLCVVCLIPGGGMITVGLDGDLVD